MDLRPDRVIAGKYRLKRHLARGGMGAVWRAEHLDLGVDVALKVLRPDVLDNDRAEARFRREARAAAGLKCPQVVQVHDFGVSEGVPYLVMELLEGEDLEDLLRREGPLDIETAVSFIEQACRGLAWVHQGGLVHRDIKPSNLFLAKQGKEAPVIKLLDFGIAKRTTESGIDATTEGLILGSPAFMSPEQARGRELDARSDLWSLGAVFYQLLTGCPPFDGVQASDVVVRICTEDAEPPSRHRTELSSAVDGFFRRALSRDPQQRFQDAVSFAEAARALLDPASTRSSRPSWTSERPLGRTSETAPIPVVSDEDVRDTPNPGEATGRASESRSKIRFSWMILLVLGIGGAALAIFSAKEDRGAGSKAAPPQPAPAAVSRDATEEKATAPSRPPHAVPRTVPKPTSPQPSSAPSAEKNAVPAVQPSAPSGDAPPPAASVEEPKTDPLFGLPMGSP